MLGGDDFGAAVSGWLAELIGKLRIAEKLQVQLVGRLQLAENLKLGDKLDFHLHLAENPEIQIFLNGHPEQLARSLLLTATVEDAQRKESSVGRPTTRVPAQINGLVRRDHYLIGNAFLELRTPKAIINRNILVSTLRYNEEKLVEYLHVRDEHFVIQVDKTYNVTRSSLQDTVDPYSKARRIDDDWKYEHRNAREVLEIDASPNVYLSFSSGPMTQVIFCTHVRRENQKYFYVFIMMDEVQL